MQLAGAELSSAFQRALDMILPSHLRFPVALLFYLLLVFALEAVFLATFMPDDSRHDGLRAVAASRPYRDPDDVAEARSLVEACLPSAFGTPLSARQLTASPTTAFSDPDPAVMDDRDEAGILEAFTHPLLAINVLTPAEAPEVPFDSVRMVVDHSSQRMPVDHEALHPLDRAAFQAAATRKTRLASLFSRLSGPKLPGLNLASLPASAIAPPMSRLDKIRQSESRRSRLGSLCALFESGVRGIFAIGYDSKGGTSYGKYQISSRKGAMRNFIAYLDKRAPSWARRLRGAGRSNTGGVHGPMPGEWKRIASEHPRLFEKLQDDFIHNYYYSPTLNTVKLRAGLDLDAHPPVVREVLWSTAVQHGPSGGASIFIKANSRAKGHPGGNYAETLLKEVFRERERRLSKLSKSLPGLRARLHQEMTLALNRLGQTKPKRVSLHAKNEDVLM